MGKFYAEGANRLTLFARQLGYLNSSLSKNSGQRAKKLADQNLPDLKGFEYLVDFLMEIGIANSDMSGITTIRPIDILAWSNGTGIELTSFEFRMMLKMSGAYCSEYSKANNNPHAIEPNTRKQQDSAQLADTFLMLDAMAKKSEENIKKRRRKKCRSDR